jgi:N-acetylmuramoyl-L-alanine amidase
MRATLLAAALAATLPVATVSAEEPKADAVECLAQAVYYEARGTSETSQAAVAHVVLNRADAEEFPDTPCAVVTEGCQFSYMCDGKPEDMAEPADRAEAFETAEEVLEGDVPDPTGGALFFHSADAADTSFFESRPRATAIGGHVFYR